MDHQKGGVLIKTVAVGNSFLMPFAHGFSARSYVRSVPCVGRAVSLQVVRRTPGRETPLFLPFPFSVGVFLGDRANKMS